MKDAKKINLLINNYWLKSGSILLGFLIILICLINNFVEYKIEKIITQTSQLSYDEVNFNIIFGDLKITNVVSVQPFQDTNQVNIKSAELNIQGLDYWQYLQYHKIVAQDLIFDNLEVNVSDKKLKKLVSKNDSINELDQVSEIIITNFQIKKGAIYINNKQFEKVELKAFSSKISDLQFFPTADISKIKWSEIALHLDDFFLNEKEQHHSISMTNIKLNIDKSLEISDLKIIPKRNKETFIEPLTYRKDRLDIVIPTLRINNFSAKEVLKNKRFITDYIQIENPTISVFSNHTKPSCPSCFKTYFYEYLNKTAFEIGIDSIVINNSTINYELRKLMNREPGNLHWSKVYAKIYDLTNIKAKNKENTKVEVNAQFMKQGDTKVKFTFPNYNSENDYTFFASLYNFDLDNINPFLNANYRLNIEQGEFIQLELSGRGNLEIASGKMILLYDNLAVKLYKSNNSERGLLTNLANSLLKERNGINNEKPRTAKMYFKRDKKKIFIENWIGTIKTGLYSALLPNIMLPKELVVYD